MPAETRRADAAGGDSGNGSGGGAGLANTWRGEATSRDAVAKLTAVPVEAPALRLAAGATLTGDTVRRSGRKTLSTVQSKLPVPRRPATSQVPGKIVVSSLRKTPRQ